MDMFSLYIIVCIAATVYIIIKSVKKAQEEDKRKNRQKNNKQTKIAFPKKKTLAITVHLFKDGYGEKKFQLKKDHKFYINEEGLKEISGEWDYDFWQITSNKSKYAFEWLREDQNNNNVSVLNFWNGGDLSKSKKAISEDNALDVIQDSEWIPGLDKFLKKKNIQPKQKDTKNKATAQKNVETPEAEEPTLSKGFGK